MKSLIAVFLLSVAVSARASQPPAQSAGETRSALQQQSANKDQEGAANQSPVSAIEAASLQPEPSSNQEPPDDSAAEHQEAASLLDSAKDLDPNWFIAALTLALFVVAFGEWKLNRTTLALTTAIERAWVGVTDVRLYSFEANAHMRASVTFKNTGNTPAYIKQVRIRVDIIGKDRLPQLPAVPDYGDEEALLVEAVIMPGEESTTYPDYTGLPPLQEHVVNDVKARNANLYVYGCVEYRDKLMPDRPRLTRFARRYDAPDSAASKRDVFYFPKMPGYNEAS